MHSSTKVDVKKPIPTGDPERGLDAPPRISIGMPVYNGSRYIADALDSLLNQTFGDFELIICDNASTDDTEQICRNYAKQDSRVKYYRNGKNIGAGPNFNLVVKYARGEFFKWAAHDDLCHRDYLETCVSLLDSNPDAVLAFPQSCIIDADANPIAEDNLETQRTSSPDAVTRFKDLTKGHRCFQVFGLIRLEDLKQTPMIGLYARGDAVLLYWLALRGRFVKAEASLFFPRRHESQSMAMLADKKKKRKLDYVAYSEWFDPRLRQRLVFPWWRGSWELLKCVTLAPVSFKDRLRCYGVSFSWIYGRRRGLAKDVLSQLKRILRLEGKR